jgi:hypothetical protein
VCYLSDKSIGRTVFLCKCGKHPHEILARIIWGARIDWKYREIPKHVLKSSNIIEK